MSRWHLQHAWDLSVKLDLSQSERCILMAVASHINGKTGQWRIGIHLLADEAGVNRSYAKRVIASLRSKGVLASSLSGTDRACTWWIPMIEPMTKGAKSAPRPARKPRSDQRDESVMTRENDALTTSALSATNTRDSLPGNDLGEITDETGDRLTAIELQLIAAKIDRGITKAEAVRDILAIRARKQGSRDHGTSTGRAPKTRPIAAVGQILGDVL